LLAAVDLAGRHILLIRLVAVAVAGAPLKLFPGFHPQALLLLLLGMGVLALVQHFPGIMEIPVLQVLLVLIVLPLAEPGVRLILLLVKLEEAVVGWGLPGI
jgi:hypothetical protein